MKSKKYEHTVIDTKNIKYSLTPNTIEIPENYRNFLVQRVAVYGKFNYYIHCLIKMYSYMILDGKLKPNKKIKTVYQERGLGLIPKRYRDYADGDWSQLKILARCLNVSVCKLVTMLIGFDMVGIEKKIVTTNHGFKELYKPNNSTIIRSKIYYPIRIKPKIFR